MRRSAWRSPLNTNNILESNTQFRKAWAYFAARSPKGKVVDTPEVFITDANVPWFIMNVAFLPKPVETEAELERSVATAVRHFASNTTGWMYAACDDWLALGLREKAPALFAAHGLKRAMTTMGMVAGRVLPPTRPLPSLEVRQAIGEEALRHIADINALAYGVPLEVGRVSFVVPSIFQGDFRGYVGYVEGKAVSVGAVMRVDGVAYFGQVATLEEHRGRGYAEVVMRHGLEEARRDWGVERTVLHATDAGRSLYLHMGYEDVASFGFYMPAPPQ